MEVAALSITVVSTSTRLGETVSVRGSDDDDDDDDDDDVCEGRRCEVD